jgi:Protein of unknown function (DUF3619)
MSIRATPAGTEALQSRLGTALAAALSERAADLPHDLAERLRAGREQALGRARFKAAPEVAPAAATVVVGLSIGRAAVAGGPASWWVKVASGLPLLVLLAGLLLIDRWNDTEQVHAAAEIDALLLADDLPPAAYTDPGFGEFLRSPRPDQP